MLSLLQTLPSKLIVMAICAGLFWLGGFCWLPARRFILPIILALFLAFLTQTFWALTAISSIAFLSLGYGDKSPLRHCFGNGWGRGVWGLLVALSICISLYLTGHLSLWCLLPYLILIFTLENALKNIPQAIGDPIIGAGVASIILLIR